MTIQLLISTMNQIDYSLLDKMNVQSDAVVVNQCNSESSKEFNFRGHSILWINTKERGLSRSRNMAIRNSTAEICMLADDDMEYCDNYVDIVLSAFERKKGDIICFQVKGIEKKFKDYSSREHKVSYLKSMKISSVEISFKRESFKEKNILFDELIGAGTEFMMGEENALLFRCLHKKLKIHYIPTIIAHLHIGNSTWFTERNEDYFIGKGAAFAAMKSHFTTFLMMQWLIRKRSLYKNHFSFFKGFSLMKKGEKAYFKKKENNI